MRVISFNKTHKIAKEKLAEYKKEVGNYMTIFQGDMMPNRLVPTLASENGGK
jgi:hypothetical protein